MNANAASGSFARRRRAFATGLLMLSAVVFLLSTAFGGSSFWMRLLQAGSEAALVGGVADWFAVVALFRRPLGLPIPHTAVVPQNKDRIGAGLAHFVAENILSPENLSVALHAAEPMRRIGSWLECEANARALAAYIADAASKEDSRASVLKLVEPALRRVDLRPLLGFAVEALTASELGANLLDDAIGTARAFLQRRARHLDEVAGRRRQGILRRSFDRQVMQAIMEGLERLLEDLSQRDNASRMGILATMKERMRAAVESTDNRERLNDWAARLVESPQFAAALGAAFGGGADAADRKAQEDLRSTLAEILAGFGARLRADESLREELDALLAGAALDLLPLQDALSGLIVEAVGRFDGEILANRIERAVDNDLQFVRINGTVVGAFVGCLLFLIRSAL